MPVGYFHIVFTVPAEIADIAFHNKAAVYDLLFGVASETMVTIAAAPRHLGSRIGITAVPLPRNQSRCTAAVVRAIASVARPSATRC